VRETVGKTDDPCRIHRVDPSYFPKRNVLIGINSLSVINAGEQVVARTPEGHFHPVHAAATMSSPAIQFAPHNPSPALYSGREFSLRHQSTAASSSSHHWHTLRDVRV
jgi:hypothetical protein